MNNFAIASIMATYAASVCINWEPTDLPVNPNTPAGYDTMCEDFPEV